MQPSEQPRPSEHALLPLAPAQSRIVLGRAVQPRAHRTHEPASNELEGLTALGPVHSERKARDWALVLQSMSVWHIIRRSYAGWMLLVHDKDYERAAKAIDGYEEENRDWPPREVRERPRHAPSIVVPLIFAALIAFFFVTGPANFETRWFQRGTAVTALILSHEPWRAVTALTLHADGVHVLGNAISGTIFASAVQRRIGPGAAALAILASGTLGNLGNAVYHYMKGEAGHASIGASTAVFGAVGLLAAMQTMLSHGGELKKRRLLDIAAPLVGGLALLGALGASPNSDLGAHLFGFLAGALVGLGIAIPLRHSAIRVDMSERRAGHAVQLGRGAPSFWLQSALLVVTLGLVGAAWQMAIWFR